MAFSRFFSPTSPGFSRKIHWKISSFTIPGPPTTRSRFCVLLELGRTTGAVTGASSRHMMETYGTYRMAWYWFIIIIYICVCVLILYAITWYHIWFYILYVYLWFYMIIFDYIWL
jgi:hypothetical protein